MPDTDFEQRLSRAMKDLVPDLDDKAPAPVVRLAERRRRRWLVPASATAVAASAAAILVAALVPGDDPSRAPAAGATGSAKPSSARPVAACEGLEVRAGRLTVDGRSASTPVTLRNPGAPCRLAKAPAMSLDLSDQAHLVVPATKQARAAFPRTISAQGSVRLRIDYHAVPIAATPGDWIVTVEIAGVPERDRIAFPKRPLVMPSGYVVIGTS